MHALQVDRSIPELPGVDPRALPRRILEGTEPVVVRGLLDAWPMVRAGKASVQDAVGYLQRFETPGAPPVVATVGPPEIDGRFFYNNELTGFNFRQDKIPLGVALKTLLKYSMEPAPPAIYIGSTTIDTWLPGFRAENELSFGGYDPLASIWIGNRTRVAAHQDLPDNLACVVAGRRRVTLFPPQQLENLYIGPLDFTPAGQAISLVDFAAPDYERFPRFSEAMRHAMVAELDPGDAVFIPSMWWHHMEGLASFNVLVNYWWRQTPPWMGTPMDALNLAMLTVRDLPRAQREVWQDVFRHYVFDYEEELVAGHLPDGARRTLAPLDEARARDMRTRLLKRLNR